MATYVEAEGAVLAWGNARTSTLVGVGNPMPKGFHLHPLHGDQVAYAQVQVTGGSATLSPENPDHRAQVSFLVFGRTREAAALAATALVNELDVLERGGAPVAAGSDASCLVADNVSGPLWSPDAAGPRYLVSAEMHLRAA